MNKDENIANLVTGNLDPEEKKKVLSDITTQQDSLEQYYKIKAAWALFSSTKEGNQYDTERTYRELQQRIHRKSSPFYVRMSPFLRYAAILLIFITTSLLIYFNKNHVLEDVKYTTIMAEYGQISKIILPDSSIVWLNSGTTLTYNNKYAITNRELTLNGQAYFDVRKGKDHPLLVACKDLTIKVLGTTFDVEAYPEDEMVRVVLESGIVQLLRTDDRSFDYQLNPGEVAQYNPESKQVSVEKIKPKEYFFWKDGFLRFDEMPMAKVIEQLERKFNVEIIVKDPQVYNSVFNANFNQESLSEILSYIRFSCPIDYKIITEEKEANKIIEFYYLRK